MIAAIHKTWILFETKIVSPIIYIFLGVTSIVNVILLCPGLDSLRETIYSMELNLFEAAVMPYPHFIPMLTL